MGEIRKKGEEISKGEDRKFQGKEEKGEKGGKNVVIHWSGPVVQLSCILGGSQSCWEIIDGQVYYYINTKTTSASWSEYCLFRIIGSAWRY